MIKQKISVILKSLGKQEGDVPCTLNADGDTQERAVVAVMSAAAQAGIKKMRVATVQSSGY